MKDYHSTLGDIMDVFGPLTEEEKKEQLEIFGNCDWINSDNDGFTPLEETEEDGKPLDPELYKELPAGITPPDCYHE